MFGFHIYNSDSDADFNTILFFPKLFRFFRYLQNNFCPMWDTGDGWVPDFRNNMNCFNDKVSASLLRMSIKIGCEVVCHFLYFQK